MGIGALWGWLGYEDTTSLGRVVLDLDGVANLIFNLGDPTDPLFICQDSPLRGYLPVGALITQLDDTSISTEGRGEDIWESYLTGSYLHKIEGEGWCVRESWWMGESGLQKLLRYIISLPTDKPETCCTHSSSSSDRSLPPTPYVGSCFIVEEANPSVRMRCLDPVPLLTGLHNEQDDRHFEHVEEGHRCSHRNPCKRGSICVHPRTGEQLLRIHFSGYDGDAQVLLWNGPRREVWEQGLSFTSSISGQS